PKASGHIFTITDLRPEHSGNYYCEAQNTRGRHKSTLNLTVVPGSLTSAAAGTITVVLLVLVLLAVFLWIRRDKLFTQQCERGERPDTGAESTFFMAAFLVLAAERGSRVRLPPISVEKLRRRRLELNTLLTRRQQEGSDLFALYSTVNKRT
ncbi:hypothetical protein INR49_018368, partial [Caranx melampygus]